MVEIMFQIICLRQLWTVLEQFVPWWWKSFPFIQFNSVRLNTLEMLEFYAVLGAAKSKDLSYGRFHLQFQLMLGEIFPRNGFCHLWALIVFEICSGEVITRNLRILNGCRFAAKYFDLYTMKIFRPSEPFSDSSSLSSKCMPIRMFITIHYSAVSRILKTRNLLQTLTKASRLLWPPTSSLRQLGGQLFS